MRYEGVVYRPPSEAGSLLIQATVGCPHNRCRFCGMYKNKRFKIRTLREIFADLAQARDLCGPSVRTLFLPDGNTIIMKTSSLVKVLERSYEHFPNLKRVTVYGSARFLALKDLEELKALRQAGLRRVHMGLESGDDPTLRAMAKGASAAESVAAGQKVKAAGLELSAYYLVGLGGRDRLREHALASAAALTAMGPDFIRLRTYYPVPEAPLYEDIQAGRFVLPSPHEALRELELLVSALEGPSMLVSDHVSNYLNLTGEIPGDKPELLAEIQAALGREESGLVRHLTHL